MKLEKIAYENDPTASMKAKVINMFKEYDIYYAMDKNPNTYSSGMKKKILLIHALINDSQFLLLDEPAANLDPDARIELFDTLYKLNKTEGKTIFICSHILKELEGIVNEATIISNGIVKYNDKVALGVDMTQLYKKSVGKVYADGEIQLPTAARDGKKDQGVSNSNLERTINILETRMMNLEKENKTLKEQIVQLSGNQKTKDSNEKFDNKIVEEEPEKEAF
jgi:ABC-type multidrug transport system ATPase subunit